MPNTRIKCFFVTANYIMLTSLCRHSEVDRASCIKNRRLPNRPARIRYKVDYANTHRTKSMTKKPAERLGMGQQKEIENGIDRVANGRKDKGSN